MNRLLADLRQFGRGDHVRSQRRIGRVASKGPGNAAPTDQPSIARSPSTNVTNFRRPAIEM